MLAQRPFCLHRGLHRAAERVVVALATLGASGAAHAASNPLVEPSSLTLASVAVIALVIVKRINHR